MSNLTKAADDARKLLRGFKAFDEVAQALEAAVSLEQQSAELSASVAALTLQRTSLEAEVSDAKADIAKHKAKAKALVDEAEEAAKATTAKAREDAASIISQANVTTELMTAEAHRAEEAAAGLVKVMQERANALAEEVKALEAKADKARAYLNKLAG